MLKCGLLAHEGFLGRRTALSGDAISPAPGPTSDEGTGGGGVGGGLLEKQVDSENWLRETGWRKKEDREQHRRNF